MGAFVRVGSVDDIPVGKLKAFEISYTRFVVAHTAEGFFAVADECTHDGEPIHSGRVRGEEIMCTRHGARFNLHTGEVTAPPAIVPIETMQVKVEGNDIFVFLE
jgi:3-phenylpropionate/trans-cinnamate dioxygenase ferredoxin subunit